MAFLSIAGVVLQVPRGQFERQPDGPGGKSKYVGTTLPVSRADEATIRAAVGSASGTDSDRAWDGTLLTDRPFVNVAGEAFGDTEGSSTTILAEVTITGASYKHHLTGGTIGTRRGLSLTIREL